MTQQATRPQAGTLSPALVRLMAVTCAVTVANLYYAQPLLHAIGGALHVGPVKTAAGQRDLPLLPVAAVA